MVETDSTYASRDLVGGASTTGRHAFGNNECVFVCDEPDTDEPDTDQQEEAERTEMIKDELEEKVVALEYEIYSARNRVWELEEELAETKANLNMLQP